MLVFRHRFSRRRVITHSLPGADIEGAAGYRHLVQRHAYRTKNLSYRAYLATQLRHNTKAMKSSTYQAYSRRIAANVGLCGGECCGDGEVCAGR